MAKNLKRRPRDKTLLEIPKDFSVAFDFKYKRGLLPVEIIKYLEWSPLQGQRIMECRKSLPTRRNDPRSKGILSQDEVVEILLKEHGIRLSRQSLTYIEKAYDISSIKPHLLIALCDILNIPLESLYID